MVRAIFPGTFDPIHFGHIDIAKRASLLFDELIVAVYDKPLKNLLFSSEDRINMVKESFKNDKAITVMGYSGMTIDFCREVDAKVIVRGLRVFSDFEHEFRMALVNHRLAPEVDVVSLITSQDHMFISSSTVREVASLNGDVSSMVPDYVVNALNLRFNDLEYDQKYENITSILE